MQEHVIELLGSQPSARLVESADSASHSPASLTTPTSRQRRERGRIEAARDRGRSRPRVRERGRTSSGRAASGDCWGPATPTSAAGSRSALYLSDDDGCGGAEEDVEPDGITVIQSALDSGSYRDKVNLQFLKIRQQQDLEHNGPDNKTSVNMVQTFYNKKQTQNMLPDERRVLEDVRKVGTQVDHIRGVRASAEGNFWNPHPGELSSTFILKTGGRTKGLKKDLREAKYVEDIREAQIHSRVQQSRADNEAKPTRIRRHEDIESDPPPNTWAAPNAHERPERPPPPTIKFRCKQSHKCSRCHHNRCCLLRPQHPAARLVWAGLGPPHFESALAEQKWPVCAQTMADKPAVFSSPKRDLMPDLTWLLLLLPEL
ncbi:MAG: hypothetical protein ACPIOQ_28560, partial [Promethearchaeia archaeon]